jgi:hypothetical protein
MSSFSRRRPHHGAPQRSIVASTLSPHGCPHVEFAASHSHRPLATIDEFAVSTLSSPSFPGHEFVVCTRPKRRLPERRAGPPPRPPQSFLCGVRSRGSVARGPRDSFHCPVSRTMKWAPYMDPIDSSFTAATRLPAQSQRNSRDRIPRGRAARHPVARTSNDPTARGTQTTALLHRPVSRTVKQRRRTGRLYVGTNFAVPVSRNDAVRSFAQGARAMEPSAPLGCPSSVLAPYALIPQLKPQSSRGCPRNDRSLTHGCPCWRHSASNGCPREAFPRNAVTCASSGLRCDVRTARLPEPCASRGRRARIA